MQDMITTIQGNATKDPRETTHQDGTVTATVRVAVNGRYFDRATGEYADRRPEFVTVFARRSLGRHVLASVRKGDPLIVTGRIGSSEWTREDGKPEFSMTLQALALGHDLSFGTSSYTRSSRREEPDVDEHTGEVLGVLGSQDRPAEADHEADGPATSRDGAELATSGAPF